MAEIYTYKGTDIVIMMIIITKLKHYLKTRYKVH